MLEIFLDKAFINHFFQSYIVDDEYFDDFYKYFVRNLRKFTVVSNYSDFDDLYANAAIHPLLELIIERSPKFEFYPNLLNKIDTIDLTISGSPFKLILTGEDNEFCNERRKRYGLEYLNPQNLSKRWKLHYSHRPDIYKKTTNDPEVPEDHRFDSWDKFKLFHHPLNAVIIIDFYLLKWFKLDEFNTNLTINILPLLSNLLVEASDEVPIEITIVSEFKDIPPLKQKERVLTSLSLISKEIKKLTSKQFSVNIIVHSKSEYHADFQEFHDRLIITNYFYIESGAGFTVARKAGFNLFDKSGKINKIKKNTEIKFRSILNIQNIFSTFFDLKNLDIYRKRLENPPNRPDYLFYSPSNNNRLLNIEHL
jgi:hypothetical protein